MFKSVNDSMKKFIFFLLLNSLCTASEELFWWENNNVKNFGDVLSPILIEKICQKPPTQASLKEITPILFSTGSVLHFARNGDIIWGSGFREDPLEEHRFSELDIRAVRGPKTRDYLLKMGIACPEVYGDPATLTADLFPEYKNEEKIYDYIIIPNIGEISCFAHYRNVVIPTLPWQEILKKINQSKFVISSSLHGIIVAESYGIPTRMLKMSWIESLLKYQDYYESTDRPHFQYATSVQEALQMGGETPGRINKEKLLSAFPWDYFDSRHSIESVE